MTVLTHKQLQRATQATTRHPPARNCTRVLQQHLEEEAALLPRFRSRNSCKYRPFTQGGNLGGKLWTRRQAYNRPSSGSISRLGRSTFSTRAKRARMCFLSRHRAIVLVHSFLGRKSGTQVLMAASSSVVRPLLIMKTTLMTFRFSLLRRRHILNNIQATMGTTRTQNNQVIITKGSLMLPSFQGIFMNHQASNGRSQGHNPIPTIRSW